MAYAILLPVEISTPEQKEGRLMQVELPEIPLLPAHFAWYVPYENIGEKRVRMGIRMEEKEGRLVVDSVAPGSPAEKAGIGKGDELLALDGVGAPIHVHREEAFGVKRVTGASDSDLVLHDGGDVVSVGAVDVTLVHTPGHTPGHCCFRTDAFVLSGDLVFAGSIGRSDFANSSPADMERSLRRFLMLPDDLPVWPGHGPDTSVGRERQTNPFLRGLV